MELFMHKIYLLNTSVSCFLRVNWSIDFNFQAHKPFHDTSILRVYEPVHIIVFNNSRTKYIVLRDQNLLEKMTETQN